MTEQALVLRRATDDDWPAIAINDARAFGFIASLDDGAQRDMRAKVDNDDVVLVFDESDPDAPVLVGVAMYYRLTMTLPGGVAVAVPGLSWVSVSATHRRRGVLRMMITELFDQWRAESSVFSALTASEGTIYERFGYGPVCFEKNIRVVGRDAVFRAPAPADSGVRFADQSRIRQQVPKIHRRWVEANAGAIARSDEWWEQIFADRELYREGDSGLHYLLHDDGFASFRIAHRDGKSVAAVEDFFAVTDRAHSDLWRVLVGLDLIDHIESAVPFDDALPQLLTNLRGATVTGHKDTLWLRILDVPQALTMRTYESDGDFVVEVVDEFQGAGGRFAFTVVDGVATVTATEKAATITLDISVLSSLYLGDNHARNYAAAGRLTAVDAATLTAFDRVMHTAVHPRSGTFF